MTFVGIYAAGHILLHMLGPFNITLRECEARVELWVKLYMAEPRINGTDSSAVTYQCFQKRTKI
jgi:hypothetical protein